VCPAGEEGADEAFGFAVGLRPVGPGAEVADAELAAGGGVPVRDVGAPIVGQHALDLDPVAGKERDRAVEEGDRGCRFLVREHLGVGEAAVVVDGSVDELPAGSQMSATADTPDPLPIATAHTGDPFAGASLDPSELLGVDVDELARSRALVANRLVETDPTEPAHPVAAQNS
jgi:hypothetical protein